MSDSLEGGERTTYCGDPIIDDLDNKTDGTGFVDEKLAMNGLVTLIINSHGQYSSHVYCNETTKKKERSLAQEIPR